MIPSENPMRIGPCPNPECQGRRKYVPGWFILPMLSSRCGKAIIVCGCGLSSPECRDEATAIAAWNSISMGWINSKDREPPKDGLKAENAALRDKVSAMNDAGNELAEVVAIVEAECGNETTAKQCRIVLEQWDAARAKVKP